MFVLSSSIHVLVNSNGLDLSRVGNERVGDLFPRFVGARNENMNGLMLIASNANHRLAFSLSATAINALTSPTTTFWIIARTIARAESFGTGSSSPFSIMQSSRLIASLKGPPLGFQLVFVTKSS